MSARYYLIQIPPVSFESEEALQDAIGTVVDLKKAIVVKGVPFSPSMQLKLTPIGNHSEPTAPRLRAVKQIPEPAEGVKATVMDHWKDGVISSKAAFVGETGMAVDTASNAVDWFVQSGGMLRCDAHGQPAAKGKSYKRAAVVPAVAQETEKS